MLLELIGKLLDSSESEIKTRGSRELSDDCDCGLIGVSGVSGEAGSVESDFKNSEGSGVNGEVEHDSGRMISVGCVADTEDDG
jgi:hypothetical protein